MNHDLGHTSCVDHFVMSRELYDCIEGCSVNISPLKTSDHCVVKLVLGYDVILQIRANGEVNFTEGNIAWHRLTDKVDAESRLMN